MTKKGGKSINLDRHLCLLCDRKCKAPQQLCKACSNKIEKAKKMRKTNETALGLKLKDGPPQQASTAKRNTSFWPYIIDLLANRKANSEPRLLYGVCKGFIDTYPTSQFLKQIKEEVAPVNNEEKKGQDA